MRNVGKDYEQIRKRATFLQSIRFCSFYRWVTCERACRAFTRVTSTALWYRSKTERGNGTSHNLSVYQVACQELLNFLRQAVRTVTAQKGRRDQVKSPSRWLYLTSDPPQMRRLVFMYLSEAMSRRRKRLPSSGDILPLSSGEGERPAHTKGSLTPSHCLFLVITSTTIESMGQGEARTLVRGGRLRNNKQMFFDDNCREGKRIVGGGSS